MVSPYVLVNPDKPIYWNLDGNVGAASPNKQDDVELVQLGLILMGNSPQATSLSPTTRALCKALVPGSACTGAPTDPLVVAIRAVQADRKSIQDGHISKMPPGSTGAWGGDLYLIVLLNNYMIDALPGQYPRLDKHAKCGPSLKAAVKRSCEG